MRRVLSLSLVAVMLLSLSLVFILSPADSSVSLMIVERYDTGAVIFNAVPPADDSISNPDYQLLPFHWYVTANYWVNTQNKYGFSRSTVEGAIRASAAAWDDETASTVFSYLGKTSRTAGRRDGYNVVGWGSYRAGVIGVTYIWYSGSRILETDMRLNTYYKWSLSGEAGKMDMQNIVTHEFGHWCGLADLYAEADYWLTMYGYSGYGETYKQTLGLGDIKGLEAVYGS